MWISSIKRTPGTNSAMPCSIYLFTTLLTSPRSLSVISVFFCLFIWLTMLMKSWPPCGFALAKSRSCSVMSCTISFFLCTSPLGIGTYWSASKSNSDAKLSLLPTLRTLPVAASIYITSPMVTFSFLITSYTDGSSLKVFCPLTVLRVTTTLVIVFP